MARIAFIGLGRMGQGMVGRYLDAGFELAVFERMDGDKPEIR